MRRPAPHAEDDAPLAGTAARQQRILQLLQAQGYVAIEDLAARFRVSPQTLRSDLRDLSARGLALRHHGGASVATSAANTDYALRHVENAAAKAAMARRAARMVADNATVFLTLGTTIEAAAAALCGHRGLHAVTNSTAAAALLGTEPGVTVHLTGGMVQTRNGGLTGPAAVEGAARYRADILLMSVGAISADGWLLDYHDDEVSVARAMFANAARTVVLADHSKFARTARCKMFHLRDVAALVTDAPLPPALADIAQAAGLAVEIAA
ncbi:MAG: DeoR/GlpR transcriptional regulator [Rhodospirillales bacterium]|nr:DeoR/GlpR transcriptional regulator [Rhodospirillales bacterium]